MAACKALMTVLSMAAMGLLHMQSASAAGPTSCFEYEDGCYQSAYEACQAVARARRADTHVDNPYDRVMGAKDAGDKFWCKLGDKNGDTDEQHYGSRRNLTEAPPPSPAAPAPEPKSEPKPKPPSKPKPDDAKPADDCELDKLKDAVLRDKVIALVRQYTAESNTRLTNDPKGSAESVPSVIGRGFFTGDYGTLLENLVAQRVAADACLSKYLRHLTATEQSKAGLNGEKGDHPDFEGLHGLKDLMIDITTADNKAKKLATQGGKQKYVYIEYERGLCQQGSGRTAAAVKIPAGADRSKIKNGVCPDRWNQR